MKTFCQHSIRCATERVRRASDPFNRLHPLSPGLRVARPPELGTTVAELWKRLGTGNQSQFGPRKTHRQHKRVTALLFIRAYIWSTSII